MAFDVPTNLAAIAARIDHAARVAGRDPRGVTLVAVSKTHPAEAVAGMVDAGHHVFGENRVQEAQAKFPALKAAHPNLKLHLIGPLQTNKARDAVELFDAIETIDRPKLAETLAREMERAGRRPDCFIQVNIGAEPQKAGVALVELDPLARQCRDLGLPLAGLMCIPPLDKEPSPYFALLHKLAGEHGLKQISMGMSADFEIAVRLGATHVRVGTALFGARPPQ